MIVVHIVILIAFLFGFLFSSSESLHQKPQSKIMKPFWRLAGLIYRKGRFSRKGGSTVQLRILYPLEDIRKVSRQYYIEKTGLALMLLFAGNLLVLALALEADLNPQIRQKVLLARNPVGEGEKTVELDVYSGSQPLAEKYSLIVGETRWTEEESDKMFQRIVPELEKAILGENKSLEYVTCDLKLVDHLEGYPAVIAWKLDRYDVINGAGTVFEEDLGDEGAVVKLTAVISYYEKQVEHEFHACIYKKPLTAKEDQTQRLGEFLTQYEEASRELPDVILPDTFEGREISYNVHQTDNSLYLFFLFLAGCLLIYAAKDKDLEKQVQMRELQMKQDYPEIVSKITLYVGAGMTLRASFEKTVEDYSSRQGEKRFAYEEMMFTVREMKSGITEGEAYVRFGNRCKIREFLKLGALLSQNLKKGSTGLLSLLEAEEREAFEERKGLARRLGEEAGTKLLLPMGCMLVVVMVIVVVPAFLSFSA